MHTVIEPHCTGCELCIPVCPVDCIELENVTGTLTGWAAWSAESANHALNRYNKRYIIHSDSGNKNNGYNQISPFEITINTIATDKSAVIAAALAKARAKQQGKQT
jgi:electron transport complex protein RnfB